MVEERTELYNFAEAMAKMREIRAEIRASANTDPRQFIARAQEFWDTFDEFSKALEYYKLM